jgi:hypothetical protein
VTNKPFARSLPIHGNKNVKGNADYASIARVGAEPTITMFERSKTVQALDSAVTVVDTSARILGLFHILKYKSDVQHIVLKKGSCQ